MLMLPMLPMLMLMLPTAMLLSAVCHTFVGQIAGMSASLAITVGVLTAVVTCCR
jgi:hypothetical protein